MAGSTMVITYSSAGGMTRVVATWTADDGTGNVSGTTKHLVGELIKGQTDPDANAPTDNYDIALTDTIGVDILGLSHDDLANRSDTATQEVYFNLQPDATTTVAIYPVISDPIIIAVTNAGNSNQGQLVLYLKGSALG